MMRTGWDLLWRVTDPESAVFWPLIGSLLLVALGLLVSGIWLAWREDPP